MKTTARKPSPARKTLRRILVTSAWVYGLLLIALMIFEPRLVYPGAYWEDLPTPPTAPASRVENVVYSVPDGSPVQGRFLARPGARNVMLYLHGNGTRSIWLDRRLERLGQAFDSHVLAAEFRGFDGSDFTPHESSVIEDAHAARGYLCQRFAISPGDVVLYGRSLGGAVAAALAGQGGARTLILERTFDRMVDVAAEHYPWAPVRWIMRNRWDSVTRLAGFQGPVIQLHGTDDSIVPMIHGRRLFYSLTTTQKVWIQVEGLGHNDWLADPDQARIVEALERFKHGDRQQN